MYKSCVLPLIQPFNLTVLAQYQNQFFLIWWKKQSSFASKFDHIFFMWLLQWKWRKSYSKSHLHIITKKEWLKIRRSGYHQLILFCDESCQKYLYFKVRVKIQVRNLRIMYYWFVWNRLYNLLEYFKSELILSSLVDRGVTLESECLGLGTQNAYKALNKVWNDSDIINIWQVMLASW